MMGLTLVSEEWRISSIQPEYMVSSIGRVMKIPYKAPMPHGGNRWYGGQPTFGQNSEGRMIFVYKGKSYKIHQLVCTEFNGPKPFDKAVVMHHDEDSTNNLFSNLLWGTQKQNLNYPNFIEYCNGRTGKNSPTSKSRDKK